MTIFNDVTGLNSTSMDKIFYPINIDEIKSTIDLAITNKKKISMRGQKHTMGGHTLIDYGYLIDMKYFNRILDFDEKRKIVKVEPGILWGDLIYFLNDFGLSPMILQSYSSFSVGGTISVNAHGITSDYGIYKSIVEIEIMDSNKNIIKCNKKNNSQLFSLIIGGYGLFGIILNVVLKVVSNVKLKLETITLNSHNFVNYYKKFIDNKKINVKLARINLTDMNIITFYSFKEVDDSYCISNLENNQHEMSKPTQIMYKWIFTNNFIQDIRFKCEQILKKPLDWSDSEERNKLLYESAKPLAKLYDPLISLNKTHILQEYFLPDKKNNFIKWINFLNKYFKKKFKHVFLLNITIRYVKKDLVSFLKYATYDMFAFVFYYRIDSSIKGDNELTKLHNDLTNEILNYNGTFYLPYRHHYSLKQLFLAYPNFNDFIFLKKRYDQQEIFSNLWYENYSKMSEKYNLSIITRYEQPFIQGIYNYLKEDLPQKNYFFRYLFNTSLNRWKYKQFLKHVFNPVDYKDIYSLIKKFSSKKDDNFIYNLISNYSKSFNNIIFKFKMISLLNKQRKETSRQFYNILKNLNIFQKKTFNGLACLGDPGYYFMSIKEKIKIDGPIFIINDKFGNFIEKDTSIPFANFIKTDINKIKKLDISSKSLDIIICYMGLHHFLDKTIDKILNEVYRILKPGGLFILREHNGYNNLIPLLQCAHMTFNAFTRVSIKNDLKEIRMFRNLSFWKKLLKKYNFIDSNLYEIQNHDTTEDYMMFFIKEKTFEDNIIDFAKKDKEYFRDLSQTYQTLPEWFSVDIVKYYGNYLEHTPWYNFPYINTIILYWTLFFKELFIVKKKCGLKKIISSYTFMNIVIGIILTLIFLQLWFLSVVPKFFYGLEGNNETNKIKLFVNCEKNLNIINVDKNIKILWKTNKDNIIYYLIEIPRYKKFTNIIIKLVQNGFNIINIAGQNEIQVKICRSDKHEFCKNEFKENKLFEYNIIPKDGKKETVISIETYQINKLVNTLKDYEIYNLHFYDF